MRVGLAAAALAAAVFAAPALSQAPSVPSKACETARKKVDREQKSTAAAAEAIARDRNARETCTSRSLCARYDASIVDNERSKARHETRLARFRLEVAQACGPG